MTRLTATPPLPTTAPGGTAYVPTQSRAEHRARATIEVLEEALGASMRQNEEIPGWLCVRLAALYRSTARYDDEVHLLERCRDSQRSEDGRTRYDARLSKARTVAERKRRRESVALTSVRASMSRPVGRRASGGYDRDTHTPALSAGTLAALGHGFATADAALDDALALACAEARASDIDVDALVAALKVAHGGEPGVMDPRFDSAMLAVLALYYDGEA